MTPMRARIRQTDKSALLERVPFLIVNNYSKFEVNIFSNERNITKILILNENSTSKRGIAKSKK